MRCLHKISAFMVFFMQTCLVTMSLVNCIKIRALFSAIYQVYWTYPIKLLNISKYIYAHTYMNKKKSNNNIIGPIFLFFVSKTNIEKVFEKWSVSNQLFCMILILVFVVIFSYPRIQ
jgi:hypothetical protein